MKSILLFSAFVLFNLTGLSFAQDEIGSYLSQNKPDKTEHKDSKTSKGKPFYSPELDDRLKAAQESGNVAEANKILNEMYDKIPAENKFKSVFKKKDDKCINDFRPPFNTEWSESDITVYSGPIKRAEFYYRQIDMKMGEDGNIYLAVNRAPATGSNGRIDVYRSSNGGASWLLTNSVVSVKAYFGSVSLLVESTNNSIGDSTRIFVLYSRSSNENNDNATLDFASWKRNGSGFYSAEIATPTTGREFAFVSALSDGAFYTTATWVGVICVEAYNDLSIIQSYRFLRSIDWGNSWVGVTFSSSVNDFYPSAQLRPGSGSTSDSVWYAVERRLTATQYEIRVFSTPWLPTVSGIGYFLTSGGSGVKYQKPVLTIKQNRTCDSAMVTVTKNGVAYYCPTFNGGGSWSADYNLGSDNGHFKSFTFCSSSPEGSNPVTAMWVSNNGDSINLRGPGKFGSLGSTIYKRNSNGSSSYISPVCIVHTPMPTTNLNAFSYAGSGPANVYANQQNLNIGINQIGTDIPAGYSLSQNFPNPFNPETKINFHIPSAGFVEIKVFDMTGKEVVSIVKMNLHPGDYSVDFDSSNLSGGVYFYKLISGEFSETKKMICIK